MVSVIIHERLITILFRPYRFFTDNITPTSSVENIYELRIHNCNNSNKRDHDKRLLDIAYGTNGGKQSIDYTPSDIYKMHSTARP